MTVFISWSGAKSKAAAKLLRSWIGDVIQGAETWMSDTDIPAGGRWSDEINANLENSNFGIMCLTMGNQSKPWIMFEAGALAKHLSEANVIPLLLDFEPADVLQGPISQFQAKRADKAGLLDVVTAINGILQDRELEPERLQRCFERCWPDLEEGLSELPEDEVGTDLTAERSDSEKIDEILELTRSISGGVERSYSAIRKNRLHGTFTQSLKNKRLVDDLETYLKGLSKEDFDIARSIILNLHPKKESFFEQLEGVKSKNMEESSTARNMMAGKVVITNAEPQNAMAKEFIE